MTNETSNRWRATLIAYAPLVLWTLVVLGFSTGQASASETSIIIRPILQFLFPAASEDTIALYHGYIRKCAHFAEYGALSFFAIRAFAASAMILVKKYCYILGVVYVLIIASLDEYNQSFEPSRTSSPYDVMLDLAGGIFVAVLFFLISRFRAR